MSPASARSHEDRSENRGVFYIRANAMNDITGYQPKGPPIVNPKPPRVGSSIMTHAESTPEPLADGYYWAKRKDNLPYCDNWEVVFVKKSVLDGQITAKGCDFRRKSHPLSYFTFGPRIEEPDKCQLRDACERLLDAVKSEYETGTNADGTPRYCSCGEIIAIAERALGINTPPPASS